VWIIGARIEARIGNKESAKRLIERSLVEVPQKKQSIGFLEYAKFYELIGNMQTAQKILNLARKSLESDWKVFFESVLTYLRNGNFEYAEKLVKVSLKKHFVTGRLWATLIQLKHAKITDITQSKKAYSVFLNAIRKIPKSGEVWCEGARLLMSPVSHKFDLEKAEKYLNFAIQFTPQYGDSFLELFKLYTLKGEIEKIEELKNL
jgi:tetratricopeptide (TPR) repeat protein